MKLQLVSDLHLERYPDFMPQPAPGAEVLVLAGDIGSYQAGSKLLDQDFGLARFSPLAPGSPWRHVLYVPGNHEYDGLDFDATQIRLRACCERLGITWLQREQVVLDGVRFLGATLWSDFDALALAHEPRPGAGPQAREVSMTRLLREREKAFRAADFYLRKNTCLRGGEPMLAVDLRELGLADQAWLCAALAETFQGSTVVVTHFAPSMRSADPRYGVTPGTAGFCNALDDLVAKVDVWLHGHLHCPSDYTVGVGAHCCRVLANPRGYASKGEQQGFREGFCLDVDQRLSSVSSLPG
jgi:predicted phosphodiesterase